MDRLLDSSDNLMSLAIDNLIPKIDGIIIENQLLDGTFHIQNIGDSRKEIDFECYSSYSEMEDINLKKFNGEPFRVEYENKFYEGKIKDMSIWKIEIDSAIRERIYSASINMAISSEGII